MSSNTNGLRVWWIPQMPMQPFYVHVQSVEEASRIIQTLAAYDDFQFKNRIKPDYASVGGLEALESGEWSEWCDDEGRTIDDVMMGVT